jgi:hypothetical protein
MSERVLFQVESSDETIIGVEYESSFNSNHFTVQTNKRIVEVHFNDEERWGVANDKQK